ncbi:SGNH/GDSL hydrolase family protein [Caldibacillus lycopersici]|uniref:SGNH/GDSL hydrolase family protein n=1 Tax=Perspicuibacillus lycopersici TaxID=1325689 RepID=A0AAE3LN98_9BACI|nr:SGNH/GDSL hydrolase family protein [Perspicuibacillus lycopersici]MCU9613632.1 SGNH/GDSL hydrolase family protein [Perspicuibacillus lycopersici]
MKKITFIFLIIFLILFASIPLFSSPSNVTIQAERKSTSLVKQSLPADFIPKTLKIAALGDSLTEGVGDSTHEGGYLKYLKDELMGLKGVKEVVVENHGVKGNRTDQLLARMEKPDVKQDTEAADIVLLTIGGNDIMKVVRDNFANLHIDKFNEEQKQYEENLHAIISKVKEDNPDAVILLIGLYNPFSQMLSGIKEFDQILNNWNNAGKEIVTSYENGYFVEIEDIFSNGNDTEVLYEDLFHPNDKGYEMIADRVFSTLTVDIEPVLNEWFVIKEEANEEN